MTVPYSENHVATLLRLLPLEITVSYLAIGRCIGKRVVPFVFHGECFGNLSDAK